jgi:hypothetical protein
MIADASSPIATETSCPGRAASAMPGATKVCATKAPTRRVAMSSPVTETTPSAFDGDACASGVVRVFRAGLSAPRTG